MVAVDPGPDASGYLPAGTRIRCTAVYDNSAKNPANPNPKKTVRWGDQTWQEMLIGYVDWHPLK